MCQSSWLIGEITQYVSHDLLLYFFDVSEILLSVLQIKQSFYYELNLSMTVFYV